MYTYIKKIHVPFFLFNSLYVVFWIILLTANYIPFYTNFSKAPDNRFYYGGDDYAIDLSGNITHVRQGYEGKPFAHLMITSEFPAKPNLLKYEYILIGKAARLFQIEPYIAIIISRIILSFFWFIVIHKVILYMFKTQTERITAAVFILFGTSFAFTQISPFLKRVINDALVFQRFILAMPHYLIGGITGITGLLFLSLALKRKRTLLFFMLSQIFLTISALTYGPTVVLIASTFPIYIVLKFISSDSKKYFIKQTIHDFILLGATTVLIGSILLYVRYIVDVTWNDFNLNEKMEFLNPFKMNNLLEYVFAIGITYIASIFALPRIIKKKDPFRFLLYGWVVMHPIGEFIISPLLDLNQLRFFIISYAVPFGLLAVDGFWVIGSMIQKIFRSIPINVSILAGCIIVLVSSYKAYIYEYKERIPVCFCFDKLMDLSYPKKEIMNAIYWLRDNTNNNEIILSQGLVGLLIPPFAGNDVFISRWYQMSGNPQFIVSRDTAGWLYSTEMPESLAKQFTKDNNISYIFSSMEERQYSSFKELPYTFLSKVYDKDDVIIYKVK